jgi:hypothetical protein
MAKINPKILAAISGAVSAYIADEEAACQAAQLAAAAAVPAGPPISLWALAGRQEAMQMRQLMQRRSFR